MTGMWPCCSGAAHLLAADRDFTGTVHFIFQPAEECAGGGAADGRGRPVHRLSLQERVGPAQLAGACRSARWRRGPAPSWPPWTRSRSACAARAPMPPCRISASIRAQAAAEIVLALQTIVSRRLSPLAPAVVSVTQMHGGDAWNVVPDLVTLRGTVRCLGETERRTIADLMARMVPGIAASHGAQAELDYFEGYPATVNWADAVPVALAAGAHVPAITRRVGDVEPSMAAEDFAYMLQACPGAYVWLGVDGTRPSKPLHNPAYDFNDDARSPSARPIGRRWRGRPSRPEPAGAGRRERRQRHPFRSRPPSPCPTRASARGCPRRSGT